MTDVREAELRDVEAPAEPRREVSSLQASGARGLPTHQGRPLAPGTREAAAGIRWRPILMMMLYMSPTLFAGVYYGLFATGRYVSHTVFLVRTASKPSGDTGLGAFLSMAGLGRAEDDTFTVQNFLQSRDALRGLQAKMPLAEMYNREGVDFLSRYPSILYAATNEDLFAYFKRMNSIIFNATTGLTTMDASAFRPEDALQIAQTMLAMAEKLVNDLNTRIHVDALGAAEEEVKRQEKRLTDAQVAITEFQNKETMIDPVSNTVIVSEIVGKLQNDLAQEQARLTDMASASPNNPSLAALRRQADVTRQQIAEEQARVTSAKEGLAEKLGTYQHLILEREFASKALGLATSSLDNARSEARRKQLYIEHVVEPELSDKTMLPLRSWTIFTVFAVNTLVLFLAWMLRSGVREHVSSTR